MSSVTLLLEPQTSRRCLSKRYSRSEGVPAVLASRIDMAVLRAACQVAQYWDQRPCNLRHSPAPVGTREYFDQVEERKYRVEPHIPHFAQFEQWRGKRVLEIGAGLGTESINFARAGAELTVVDISLESLNLCKKRFEVYGLEASFVHANAEELASVLGPERAAYYDLVWSFGVIHHTPHPARAIDSIRTLLKPGGELRIMVYSKISYKLFFLMRETGQWDFSKVDSIISTFSEAQTGYVPLPRPLARPRDGGRALASLELTTSRVCRAAAPSRTRTRSATFATICSRTASRSPTCARRTSFAGTLMPTASTATRRRLVGAT